MDVVDQQLDNDPSDEKTNSEEIDQCETSADDALISSESSVKQSAVAENAIPDENSEGQKGPATLSTDEKNQNTSSSESQETNRTASSFSYSRKTSDDDRIPKRKLDVVVKTDEISLSSSKLFSSSKYARRDLKSRKICLGPINYQSITDRLIEEVINKSITLSMTWKLLPSTQEMDGSMVVHFLSAQDESAIKSRIKERQGRISNGDSIHIRTPSRYGDVPDDFTSEWEKALFPCKPELIDYSYLFVNNLPPDTTTSCLYELFPDACGAVLPLKKDGTSEGYAIVEFYTRHGARVAAEESRTVNGQRITMFVIERNSLSSAERQYNGGYIRRDTAFRMAGFENDVETVLQRRINTNENDHELEDAIELAAATKAQDAPQPPFSLDKGAIEDLIKSAIKGQVREHDNEASDRGFSQDKYHWKAGETSSHNDNDNQEGGINHPDNSPANQPAMQKPLIDQTTLNLVKGLLDQPGFGLAVNLLETLMAKNQPHAPVNDRNEGRKEPDPPSFMDSQPRMPRPRGPPMNQSQQFSGSGTWRGRTEPQFSRDEDRFNNRSGRPRTDRGRVSVQKPYERGPDNEAPRGRSRNSSYHSRDDHETADVDFDRESNTPHHRVNDAKSRGPRTESRHGGQRRWDGDGNRKGPSWSHNQNSDDRNYRDNWDESKSTRPPRRQQQGGASNQPQGDQKPQTGGQWNWSGPKSLGNAAGSNPNSYNNPQWTERGGYSSGNTPSWSSFNSGYNQNQSTVTYSQNQQSSYRPMQNTAMTSYTSGQQSMNYNAAQHNTNYGSGQQQPANYGGGQRQTNFSSGQQQQPSYGGGQQQQTSYSSGQQQQTNFSGGQQQQTSYSGGQQQQTNYSGGGQLQQTGYSGGGQQQQTGYTGGGQQQQTGYSGGGQQNVTSQQASYSGSNQQTHYGSSGQLASYGVSGQQTSYGVSGQQPNYSGSSQQPNYSGSSQQMNYGTGQQQANYGGGQQTNYSSSQQQANYSGGQQQANYSGSYGGQQQMNYGSSQQTTNYGQPQSYNYGQYQSYGQQYPPAYGSGYSQSGTGAYSGVQSAYNQYSGSTMYPQSQTAYGTTNMYSQQSATYNPTTVAYSQATTTFNPQSAAYSGQTAGSGYWSTTGYSTNTSQLMTTTTTTATSTPQTWYGQYNYGSYTPQQPQVSSSSVNT